MLTLVCAGSGDNDYLINRGRFLHGRHNPAPVIEKGSYGTGHGWSDELATPLKSPCPQLKLCTPKCNCETREG